MELRTIKVELLTTKEQRQAFISTATVYNAVFNYFVELGKEFKSVSYPTLHKLGYPVMRSRYPQLPSNLVQSAAKLALGSLKSWNTNNPKKKWGYRGHKTTLMYRVDKLTLSRRGNLTTVSTAEKRLRFFHSVPDWFVTKYGVNTNAVQCGAIKVVNSKVFLYLSYKIEVADSVLGKSVVGIDRGLYNLCTTSRGENISSKRHRAVKCRYQHLRKVLQQKGTKSAKRKLAKLSGKEKRFMLDVNHQVTKHLADAADVSTYVLEKLESMRVRKGQATKKLRSWLSNWSYYQFEQLLLYKCRAKGIDIVYVDPRYTSQKCSCCGNVDKLARNKSRYCCPVCGAVMHADINAAINIRENYLRSLQAKQADFNQPNVCKSALEAALQS